MVASDMIGDVVISSSLIAEPGRTVRVVGAAIVDRGRCLAARRGPANPPAGLWEFPGGKVEPGETPEAALAREIEEELGVDVEVQSWLGQGTASVGDRQIVLDVYLCRLHAGEPQAREHDALRWITIDEIPSLDWARADVPVLPVLARRMRRQLEVKVEDPTEAEVR